MIAGTWYERPAGDRLSLSRAPRLASWNKATDPDQIKLRQYLDEAESLLGATQPIVGPWALLLEVGLPAGRSLLEMADLDNYAFPLAKRLYSHDLVSVWASKRHAPASYITAAPARKASPPAELWPARTSSSADGVAYKEQVRAALASAAELPAGPVSLQIAFAVGPRRNWLNLWKPTIDALDPLLGRATRDRLWHPNDGRVIDLGLHVTTNRDLGNEVQLFIAAWAATTS